MNLTLAPEQSSTFFDRVVRALTPRIRANTPRQMQILETLPLGGRRQVTLISCDGQRFLVGCGVEDVTTIVPLAAEAPPCL